MSDSVLTPENNNPVQERINNSNHAKTVLMTLGGLALLLLGGAGVYGIAKQKPELLGIKKDSSQDEKAAQAELETLVKEIGEIIELPEGESPTLATVTDLEQVKSQAFFAKAKNGDKVLVYAIAKKAILYRPSDKKIIEVGVVNMPAPTGVVAGETSEKLPEVQTPTPVPTIVPAKAQELPTSTPIVIE